MSNLFANTSASVFNLLRFYRGPIVDQLNEDVAIYRGAEKMKFNWSGEKVMRPLRVRRNQGVGATSDGGNLPTIGRQTGIQAQIAAKYNYLRFGLTGPMMKAAQNDKGSFVRQFDFELKMGMEDLRSELNRQMSWDGTGDLARINTTANASTTIVIKGREDTEAALKFLDVGATIDVYSSTTLVASGVQISSISSGDANSATATIVLDTAVSVTANDIVVRSGATLSNEIQGLLTQLDGATSTVFEIDRSAYPATQGNVVDLNSASLSLDSLQQLQNLMERRGGSKLKFVYSDFDSRRYYQKLLAVDKRYVNTVKGDGGFSKADETYLEWNGVPWVADKDCPTRIFMLPGDAIEKAVLCEMEVADETGTPYIAQSGVDAWEVRIRQFCNLFNAKASGSGVLVDYVSP
jgi:hypothetical protein